MIVPVMAISNLVLIQQIYSEETNGAHAHYREPVPLIVEPTLHHIIDNSWQCVRLACSSRSDRGEWRALLFASSPLSECLWSEN